MIAARIFAFPSTRIAPILALALLVSSCGEQESSAAEDGQVLVAATFSELPFCWFGKRGAVYFVSSTEQFFYCDGRQYVELAMVGQDGQDGQDGSSCTVARDDAAGLTTIRCEDGTVAVLEDGRDGQDGASCVVAEAASGASITCGGDTVSISDGADGSSCSADTDASGAVTISCDDGTSATIPAGGEGGATVELICEVIAASGLYVPRGLECVPSCPCFTEAEVLASSETGCRDLVTTYGARQWATLPNSGFLVERRPSNQFACIQEGPPRVAFDNIFVFSFSSAIECIRVIESAAGPCEQIILCDSNDDCFDDGNSCTSSFCGDGECVSVTLDNGSPCDDGGQCLFGNCQPVIGP